MYDCYLLTYEPLSRAKPSVHYQTGEQLSTTVQFSFTSVPQLLTINFQFNKLLYLVLFSFSTHLSIWFLQHVQVAIELSISLWRLTRLSDCISVPHHIFIVPLAETFLFLLLALMSLSHILPSSPLS